MRSGCRFYTMQAVVLTVLIVTLFRGALDVQLLPAAFAQQSVINTLVYALCNTRPIGTVDSFAPNLDAVVQSLKQNASRFLYSWASSQTGSQSNYYMYGIYQCRGDLSPSQCSSCVDKGLTSFQSIDSIDNSCSRLRIGARAQYRGCYVRYENYSFYDGVEPDGVYFAPPLCTGSSNDSSYQQNVATALHDSTTAAPHHPQFGYNATTIGLGSNSTAYALSQCFGYLNSSQCATCLAQLSNISSIACNRSSVSGSVFFDSCYYLFNNTPLVFTSPSSVNSKPAASAPSPTPTITNPSHNKKVATIVGTVVGISALLAIIAAVALYFLKRQNKYLPQGEQLLIAVQPGARRLSLQELQDATNNFHPNNKLGEGGFGPVYQGRLKSGKEVAIKMLSAQSHQGKSEFVNEVNLITTVQHRNLIQLIGYCMEDSKPLLVYEYIPNRSLDLHLFDVHEDNALDWYTRFNIIVGIARGLRYLHEDPPVRIIHRDIKASNILLDNNLNPKIADFGLARLFADDRSHITTRVVGTLGYLAPEYAINGQLTEKADVYSFGLLALEIVSGRRVVDNKCEADKRNLLDWTWVLYEKQQQLQIVDERMQKAENSLDTNMKMNVNEGEVIRVVHVALLCTQLQPQARPSMSEVHNMLCGQLEILNLPTKPMTIGIISPIGDLLHDGSSGMFMPSWTAQPSVKLTYSNNADPISQVEPR